MGTRTGNPTWQDSPSTATLISATRLNAIEREIDESAAIADAVPLSSITPLTDTPAGFAGTAATAAHGDHRHPAPNLGYYPVPASATGLWFAPLSAQDSRDMIANVKCPGTPFPVPRAFHLKGIGFRMQTVGDGGSWKLAVYASDSAGMPTGAPVWTSTASTDLTAGNKIVGSLDVALDVGMYWLFFGSYGFTTTRARPGQPLISYVGNWLPIVGASNYTPALALNGFNETSGAFPTLATYDFVNSNIGSTLWGYEMSGDLS